MTWYILSQTGGGRYVAVFMKRKQSYKLRQNLNLKNATSPCEQITDFSTTDLYINYVII